MRRPAGVILAAVVLALMALAGIFGSLVSVAASLFLRNNPAIPAVPGMRAMMVVSVVVMLCFFLFCAWTVVGLFRMRAWARFAILAIGGLEFFFCALGAGVMILVRNMPQPMPTATPAPIGMPAVFIGIAAFYGLLSLIGAWWLVYFNLAPVREAFRVAGTQGSAAVIAADAGEPARPALVAQALPATSGWRMVIVVWACLMLVGVLFLPVLLVMRLPVFLLGVVFRGNAATGVLLAMVAVQVYLAVGLLRKWRAAWYVGMAWQIYTIVFFLTFLLPSVWARFMAYQEELMGRWGFTITGAGSTMFVAPRPVVAFGLVMGAAVVAILTIALVRRREDYLQA